MSLGVPISKCLWIFNGDRRRPLSPSAGTNRNSCIFHQKYLEIRRLFQRCKNSYPNRSCSMTLRNTSPTSLRNTRTTSPTNLHCCVDEAMPMWKQSRWRWEWNPSCCQSAMTTRERLCQNSASSMIYIRFFKSLFTMHCCRSDKRIIAPMHE